MLNRRIAFASLTTLLLAGPALAQTEPDPVPPPQPPAQPEPPQPPMQPEPPRPPDHTMMQPAVEPPPTPSQSSAGNGNPTFVKGNTELTFYGFMQLYGIYDSTQGFNEQQQNGAIQRPHTYGGDHGQTQLSARHSRFGFKAVQPITNDIKGKVQMEADFLGNQPSNPPTTTESAFYQNATMRFRHYFATLETPYVDIVGGQWWSLFGWQSYFHPNSVEIQGLPGQAYKRVAQFRLARTIKTDFVDIDVAIAAQRPPERASATPDGVAGIKFTFNKLKGWRTRGANDSGLDSAAFGVSVIGRKFAADPFSAVQVNQVVKYGAGLSLDAMIPVIPATKENHGMALTVTGSFVQGHGIEDQYDGLTFGVANPALPNPTMAATPPVYTANIDNGLAMFSADGTLHPIQLQTYMVGAQFYLPPNGRAWISGNFTHTNSNNAALFGTPAKIWNASTYFDVDLFFDLTPAARFGFLYSRTDQTFAAPDSAGGTDAVNNRFTGTMMFMF